MGSAKRTKSEIVSKLSAEDVRQEAERQQHRLSRRAPEEVLEELVQSQQLTSLNFEPDGGRRVPRTGQAMLSGCWSCCWRASNGWTWRSRATKRQTTMDVGAGLRAGGEHLS